MLKKIFIAVSIIFASLPIFYLGFYHDDWATIVGSAFHGSSFSLDRLSWASSLGINRPILIILLFIFSSIANASPAVWHLISSLLLLSSVLLMAKFFQNLLTPLTKDSSLITYLAFSFLFIWFPWNGGVIYFLTVSAIATLPTLIFFLICGIFSLKFIQTNTMTFLFLAALFYALSLLTYEAFYFQFIYLCLLLFSINYYQSNRFRNIVIIFIALGIIQILALVWNRELANISGTGPTKNIYPLWIDLAINSARNILPTLAASFREKVSIFGIIFIIYAISCLSAITTSFRNNLKKLRQVLLALAAIVIGTGIYIVLYAVAGYGPSGIGIFSRASLTVSFLIVQFLLLIHLLVDNKHPHTYHLYRLSIYLLAGIFIIGAISTFQDWKESWIIQQKVIKAFPVQKALMTSPDSLIIYIGPFEYHSITIFQAYWDITGAINATYFSKIKPYPSRNLTVGPTDWETTWDGHELIQKWKNNKVEIARAKTSEIWIWNYYANTFMKVQPGQVY